MNELRRYVNVLAMVLLAISLIFSVQIYAAADNWSVFRHDPQHSGFFNGAAPTAFAAQLWNYTLDASTYSSPGSGVVAEGRVYAGSVQGDVYCFDASNGDVVWTFSAGSLVESSPAVSGGRVYVGAEDGTIYCLDASNGARVWASSIGESVDSPVNFADGRVYVESWQGNVYCLDAANGNAVWNFQTGGKAFQSCPAVSGGYVYVANDDGNVLCLTATDGARVWNFTAGGAVRSPTVTDGFVYFGSKDGNAYCLDAFSGLKIWNYTTWFNSAGPSHGYTWGNAVSDAAVAYGRVFVGSSDFDVFCLDASTGEKIWNFTTAAEVYAAPAVADGCVFVGSYDGNLYCLNASTGAEIWRGAAGVFSPVNAAGSVGSPVVAEGVVYVVGNGVLTAWGSPSAGAPFPVGVIGAIVIVIVAAVSATYAYGRLRRKKTAVNPDSGKSRES
ncbi:MAG: PQQ-binding-like beta-propeller repeat protein [Candidatus Bathyarchaeia archaeon]